MRFYLLRAEDRAPTVPSELILLICTVLWSALVRRYQVAIPCQHFIYTRWNQHLHEASS
jgi:hypothetical protein